MALRTLPFDPAEHVKTPEAVRYYLADALEGGVDAEIADACVVLAGSPGLALLARDAGLDLGALQAGLTEPSGPALAVLVDLASALGLRLTLVPAVENHA